VPSPQFAGSDETTPPSIERALFERQTGGLADSVARDALDLASDAAMPADARSGAGSGSAKTRKIQVVAKFLTLKGPFVGDDVTMRVYADSSGLVWKPSMKSSGDTFLVNQSVIRSDTVTIGASERSLTVELQLRLLQIDHDVDPNIDVVFLKTSARFGPPEREILTIDVHVLEEVLSRKVDASDRNDAIAKAVATLKTVGDRQLSKVREVTKLDDGRFEVTLSIARKLAITHPPTLKDN